MKSLKNTKLIIDLLINETFRKLGLTSIFKSKLSRYTLIIILIMCYGYYFALNLTEAKVLQKLTHEMYSFLFISTITTSIILGYLFYITVFLFFRVSNTIKYVINTFPVSNREVFNALFIFKFLLVMMISVLFGLIFIAGITNAYRNILILSSFLLLYFSLIITVFIIMIFIEIIFDSYFQKNSHVIKSIVFPAFMVLSIQLKFKVDNYLLENINENLNFMNNNFSFVAVFQVISICILICIVTIFCISRTFIISKHYKTNNYWKIFLNNKNVTQFKKIFLALIREKTFRLIVIVFTVNLIISIVLYRDFEGLLTNIIAPTTIISLVFLYYCNTTLNERKTLIIYNHNFFIEFLILQSIMLLFGILSFKGNPIDLFSFIYICNAFLIAGLLFPKDQSTINEFIAIIIVIFSALILKFTLMQNLLILNAFAYVVISSISLYLLKFHSENKCSTNLLNRPFKSIKP